MPISKMFPSIELTLLQALATLQVRGPEGKNENRADHIKKIGHVSFLILNRFYRRLLRE
jgi:hypothetical protein